jgi:hypothetical protein
MSKTPDQILITTSIEWINEGITCRDRTGERATIKLSEKLGEYLTRLGYTSDHTIGLVLRLMTLGKVKVEFREYRERLELADYKDIMTRPKIIEMFDEFVAKLNPAGIESANMTQRIVVQPKRR